MTRRTQQLFARTMTERYAQVPIFALAGGIAGVLSAAGVAARILQGDPALGAAISLPGPVFGVAVGWMLARRGALSPRRGVMWAIAASLGNAGAVLSAIAIGSAIDPVLGGGIAVMLVPGVAAGAVGGGSLAGVTALIAPTRRWWLLAVAGTALGAFLPLLLLPIFGEEIAGTFLFYAIWQGGYAATLPLILPTLARRPPPRRGDFPTLGYLLEAYFHQDWRVAHADADAVVPAIVAREGRDTLDAAAAEVAGLLARGLPEAELKSFFDGTLYVDYLPNADGVTYAHWLETLHRRFAAVAAKDA